MNIRTKLKLADFAQCLLQTQNEITDLVDVDVPYEIWMKICNLDMLMHEVRGRISDLTDKKTE